MKGLIKDKKTKALLTEMLTYTMHPYWNYWVKVKDTQSMLDEDFFAIVDEEWMKFKSLLDTLRNREITGDKAHSRVEDFFEEDCAPKLCELFGQIINRDLKIGMQLKSFEKHLGEFVPKFSPMLAATWDGEEIKDEIAIEPKLDGLRCLAVFPDDGKTLPTTVSRNGRPIYNTEKIIKHLQGRIKGWILDGEIVGSSWGDGISSAHTKNKEVTGSKFIVFDAITIEEWEARKSNRTYRDRRSKLKNLLIHPYPEKLKKYVEIIKPICTGIYSPKRIEQIYRDHVDQGLEGVVIKRTSGTYDFKRTDNWLKRKFKDTVDCKVVGRIEGKHRNKGKLGALIVEGKINGQKFRSEVGQGLSDENRNRFWKMPEKELKQLVVEIEHYGLTDSLRLKKSDKLPAVRNGVFLRVREDKMER
jgi:ATP-dependent DNA ligase